MTEPAYLTGITDNRERMYETLYRNCYGYPEAPGIEPRANRAYWEREQLDRQVKALESDGWFRQRQVDLSEVESLTNRAVLLTKGGKILRKWDNFFSDGSCGWEFMAEPDIIWNTKELRGDSHFPATLIHEGSN